MNMVEHEIDLTDGSRITFQVPDATPFMDYVYMYESAHKTIPYITIIKTEQGLAPLFQNKFIGHIIFLNHIVKVTSRQL
jgi:hypothetical protein